MKPTTENRYGKIIAANISRPIRETKLEVLDYPLTSDPGTQLTAPGTATVYVARRGTQGLEAVRKAVKEHGRGEKIKAEMERQISKTKSVPLPEFADLMLQQPLLADIRYGGATLMHGFFLPEGVDLFTIPLAYNGGSLSPEGFMLVEHYVEGSNASYEALVVRSSPSLTHAEQAALRLVPKDQLVNNVAVLSDWCDTTWWVIAAAVIAATAVTVENTCICAAMAAVQLPDETIKKLGPAASAREMTSLRAQALVNSLKAG